MRELHLIHITKTKVFAIFSACAVAYIYGAEPDVVNHPYLARAITTAWTLKQNLSEACKLYSDVASLPKDLAEIKRNFACREARLEEATRENLSEKERGEILSVCQPLSARAPGF
jgi:hypothetical protein